MDTRPTPYELPRLRVAYEPITVALCTLSLLGQADRWPGLNPWLHRVWALLTPEQRRIHRMIFGPLRGAFFYGNAGSMWDPAQEFGSYLLDLDEMTTDQLRDNVLESLRERLRRTVVATASDRVPSAERLLAERATFVASYEHLVRTESFTAPIDTELLHEAHDLLHDLERLRKMTIEYLFDLWERDEGDEHKEISFKIEWGRIKKMVGWHAQMYARALHDLGDDIPLADAFRDLTGRDLPPEIATQLAGAREVVLVPCWHLGRWVLPWEVPSGTPRLCFSEPPNADVPLLRRTPVGRAELRARMAALADETRLHILELVRAHDEMTAQELVAELDLSQSNVSRHLNQLVQMGYLFQRRGEGANKTYRVSAYHLTRTAGAIRRLAEGEPFEPEPREADVSPELRRFVDREGRLTTWPPAHQRDKLLVLEYLAAAFEPGRVYSERELGEVLDRRSTIADDAALRRALYEFRFMNRARDGSRYWLSGTLPEDQPGEEPAP